MNRNLYGQDERVLAGNWRDFEAYAAPRDYLNAQFSPAVLAQLDPWAAAYFQGIAPRGFIGPTALSANPYMGQTHPFLGQSVQPANPFVGQAAAYRTFAPALFDQSLRMTGAMAEIDPSGYALQQRMLQQQQLRQHLGQPSLRGMGPKNYVRPDELVKDDVCKLLTKHPAIDASDISVEVRQGIVALDGTVTERAIKREVEDLIENVIGVNDIENRITVRPHQQLDSAETLLRGQARASETPAGKPRH